MSFRFIDNAAIDRETMRSIRSHAAKGKNTGKGRPRKMKKHATLEHPRGDALDLIPMAFDLEPSNKTKLRQLLTFLSIDFHQGPMTKAIRWDMKRSIWVTFIFIDEAYFHCNIAMLNSLLGSTLIGAEDSSECIQHLNRTFRLVNDKLSGDQATAASTFAAVIALTHWHRIRDDHDQGMLHMDGLEQMAFKSGGIQSLVVANPAVAQKVFRTDLEFALHLGSRTRFSKHDIPAEKANDLLTQHDAVPRPPFQADTQEAFLMLQRLSDMVNHAILSTNKIDGYVFHDCIIMIGYHLIDICPFSQLPLQDAEENLLFCGMTAFTATFLTGLHRRLPTLPLIVNNIRVATLSTTHPSKAWDKICIWTLLIGRTTILTSEDDMWLLPIISDSMSRLLITSASDLRKAMIGMPWIDILHDHLCQALFNKLQDPSPS